MLAAYVFTIGLSNNEFRYRLPVLALTAAFGGYALARGDAFWPLKIKGRQKAEGSNRGLPTAYGLLPSGLGAVAAWVLGLLFVIVSLRLILPGLGQAIQARTYKTDQRDPSQRAQALE